MCTFVVKRATFGIKQAFYIYEMTYLFSVFICSSEGSMYTPHRSTSNYGMKKEHKCRRIIPFDSINILYVHHDIDKNKRKLALRLLSGFITGFQLCTRSTDTKCHEWSRRQADASELAYVRLRRTHHRARRGKAHNNTTHKAHNSKISPHPQKSRKEQI